MLGIYAHTLLTATRTNSVRMRDMRAAPTDDKRRWRVGRNTRWIDPTQL